MSKFEGKVALITGAGGMRGVGRSIALELARDGADIAITDIRRQPSQMSPGELRSSWRGLENVAEEVEALGRQCFLWHCDLSQADQIRELVNQVLSHYNHIDILVNNARTFMGQDKVPITELDEEVFGRFLAVNTTAVFILCKLVGKEMISRGIGSRIINIASNASKTATAGATAYAASKFAVLGITQAAALDLAPYGITVNAVCPGSINTDRVSHWERARAAERGMSVEDFRAEIVKEKGQQTPLGRIAEPEDVAHLVSFLASEEASFITGQAYNINGGASFH
jgi:NAD(P)-dependent dehydrogenase (short-subunit alcohol dehydrogenase family)